MAQTIVRPVGQNLNVHNVVGADFLNGRHLKRTHGQNIRQFRQRNFYVNIIFEPIE